jgi:hypothetical protein
LKNTSIIFVTKYLEYRSSGEAYSCSAAGKNSLRSVKPDRVRHGLKIPSVHLILQHLNPVGISLSSVVKAIFNKILLSTAKFPKQGSDLQTN